MTQEQKSQLRKIGSLLDELGSLLDEVEIDDLGLEYEDDIYQLIEGLQDDDFVSKATDIQVAIGDLDLDEEDQYY